MTWITTTPLLAWCLALAPAGADQAAPPARVADAEQPPAARAEMESEVQMFLRQHHAELAQVLDRLQSTLPHEYDRAIRDLWRVRQRLVQLAERDPQRYQGELKSWVLESHLHLAVARLAMNDSPALREEIRQLLHQQAQLKLDILRNERHRLAERLRKLDEQIERMNAQREQIVQKQLLSLTRSSENLAATARGTSPRPKRPAGDSAADRGESKP